MLISPADPIESGPVFVNAVEVSSLVGCAHTLIDRPAVSWWWRPRYLTGVKKESDLNTIIGVADIDIRCRDIDVEASGPA